MELYTYLNYDDDRRHCKFDFERYREENKKLLIQAFQNENLACEVHIFNRIPEMNFCEELVAGNDERWATSLKLMLNDCSQDDSSLCRLFSKTVREDGAEMKAEIFLRVMEGFLTDRFRVAGTLKPERERMISYDVFYGNPSTDALDVLSGCHGYHFRIELPGNIVARNEKRFFDLDSLSTEEMSLYVVPKYYSELGMWDRKNLRNDKEKMKYLTDCWIETLFAALA